MTTTDDHEAVGQRTADVTQVGYDCGHATRSRTNAELKAAGYTHVRVTGYLDVGGPCPACTAARPKKRRPR